MKITTKRLLSMVLVLAMTLSMLPSVSVPVLAEEEDSSTTKDALGISMAKWTAEEKAAAEANLPFGTGYGTWTTLFEMSELYFSMGYDNNTRLTGFFDWNNEENTTDEQIGKNIINFKQSQLTSQSQNYKIVTTAAIDLMGSGKKEYVVNLALQTSKNRLCLYITDSKNNLIGNTVYFDNVAHLSELKVYQINGAFDVVAGDFDGDGKDTVVVYIPQTDSSKETQNGISPFIAEYSVSTSGAWELKSTIAENVLTLLGNGGANQGGINKITTMKNSPLVDLVAEDVDKDGYDELIVTGGMNDVTNDVKQLGTKVFIYDKMLKNETWNQSYYQGDKVFGEGREILISDAGNKRIVWGGTTVGNIIADTSTVAVDYPEIITAGFIDGESSAQDIKVVGSDDIGVSVLRVKEITSTDNGKNVICSYEKVFDQNIGCNGWTKGGFFESEDINSLLQLQAYADQGLAAAESVFISGSVYRINSNNKLEEVYKHTDFNGKDKGAGSLDTLKNTIVAAVTAGNFNGNNNGREQLIFVTSMKESGKNNAYSRVYCYYYDTNTDKYEGKRSSYLTEHKGSFHVSLATLDPDNDSIIAKLESVDREYTAPYVLAILEAAPHFAEIEEGDVGNSETIYGQEATEGHAYSNSFGFTLGTSVGYEFESDLTQSGGGFELAVDQAFNWSTANSTTVTWATECKNDTNENLVVVYRCPVVVYTYKDQNGKTLVVEKVGQPAEAMITVDQYNEAAEQYKLELIDDKNAKLGTPGDPFSYRKNTEGLDNAVQYNGIGETASSTDTTVGWQWYSSMGSKMQGLTIEKSQEKTFSYDVEVSLNVFAKGGGFTTSVSYGFAYAHEETSIDGSSVTKSGTVSGKQVDGYDFRWKFAAWNCELDGITVPVIGYLVDSVKAPPSPPKALVVEDATTTSVTICWKSGTRAATQYRIYRVLDTIDTDYVLVGAVNGDETSYTLSGLKPGETYTYVVRGVAFEEDGDALESVDSAPITVRTQRDDSNVTLKLYSDDLSQDGSTLQSTGKTASLNVQVSEAGGNALSYQWQILEPGTEGAKHGWLAVSELAKDTIGTVKGATSSSLTMKTIDESLSGAYLRCVVNVTSPAGDVDTYYSSLVTLDLSGLDTTTTLVINGYEDGSGNVNAPYTGTANYDQVTETSTTGTLTVPVTVMQNGKEYTIYKDETGTEAAYVGVYETIDDENGVSRSYYAVEKTGDSFTVSNALSLEADSYTIDSGTFTIPSDFTESSLNEITEKGTYEKHYLVSTNTAKTVTLTEYWYGISDGQYYEKNESGFTLAAPQPNQDEDGEANDADLRTVFYDTEGTVILGADGVYDVYTVGESATTNVGTFHSVTGTKLYTTGAVYYADSAALETVTKEKTFSSSTTTVTPVSGTALTLSAVVTNTNGREITTPVNVTITNADTGMTVAWLTLGGEATATWTAPASGLYRITAVSTPTIGAKSSTTVCYYRAEAPTESYRLFLMQGANQVTHMSYDGSSSVEPVLMVYNGSSWEVAENVTYYVGEEELDSETYTPDAAGSYRFTAEIDGKTVAATVLTVNKTAITVTPVWEAAEGVTNTVPAYEDISIVVTDENGNELTDLTRYFKASCDLYSASGALNSDKKSGTYTVAPVYKTASAESTILSRYTVTMNTGTIYYFCDAITVYFDAGENGDVFAYYIDPSGAEFAFENGSQIGMDYRFKFVADPDEGWSVDEWTAIVTPTRSDLADDCKKYGNTLEFTEELMEQLVDWMKNGIDGTDLDKQIDIFVTFTNRTHEITYSAGNSGTLAAATGDTPLSSGASVAHNANVTFTATPAEGYMVDKWTVDGVDYKWDSGDLYRENTLTLTGIDDDHEVVVSFTAAQTTTFHVSAVDESGKPDTTGATIAVTDAQGEAFAVDGDGTYSISYADAVTFTAQLGNTGISVVKAWQTSTDGTNWTTVAGSVNTVTLYSHASAKLYVRTVIVPAQTYTVSWSITLEDGTINDEVATLTASANGTEFDSGDKITAGMSVDFVLTLADAYEVANWSNNVTAEGLTATLESLTENTTVTVTIRKKDTVIVTYSVTNGDATGCSLSAMVDNNILSSGDSARYDQTVSFTAVPTDGYRVKEWTLDGNTWTDAETRTEMTLSLSGYEEEGSVSVTVEFTPIGNEITCSAGEHGKIVSAKIGSDAYDFTNGFTAGRDAEVVVTAEPDTGYEVKAWKVNGVTQTGEAGNTFTYTADGASGAVISVEFQCAEYTVSWTAANGTVSAGGYDGNSAQIRGGESVTFTAVPANGYVFDYWTVNNVKQESAASASFTWTVPTDVEAGTAYTISAVFVKNTSIYTVTYSAGNNGTISVPGGDNGTVAVAAGNSVTFTAAPNAYYKIKEWRVNGAKVPNSANRMTYTLTNVMSDCTVTVVFESSASMKVEFRVDGSNGALTATQNNSSLTSGQYVSGGSTLVFTATPDTGYMVKSWWVNGTKVTPENMAQLGVTMEHYLSNSLTISSLKGNTNVVVKFEEYVGYDIPATDETAGYIITNVSRVPDDTGIDNQIRKNGDVTFKVTPESGKAITSITCQNGTVTANADGSYTVTIENVTADIELDVTVLDGIILTINCGTHGTLTVTRDGQKLTSGTTLQIGDVLTIKAVPDSNYRLKSLTVNGNTFSSGRSYTVSEEDSALLLKATFTKLSSSNSDSDSESGSSSEATRTVTIRKSANGQVTADNIYAVKGDTVTLTVTPDSGYTLETLSVWDKNGKTVKLTDKGNGKYTFRMPATKVTVAATFTEGNTNLNFFVDVTADKYYYEAVSWAAENNITSGIGDNLFAPDQTCTRAQIVTFLWRAAGEPEPIFTRNPFTDVSESQYYYKAVLWAVERGITNGTSADTFSPDATCTRAHAAAFLYRFEQANGGGFTGAWMFHLPFTDVPEWCFEAVAWCYKEEITLGTSSTTFSPDKECTRAHIVTFLYRLLIE